jgi:2-keto-4-pentenoate hydratase/2-oxohepta-3-ene-1,7-dioic acid hydratase in catechol pathway
MMRLARAAINGQLKYGDVESETFYELEGGILENPRRTGRATPLAEAKLLAPIDPGRILFVMGGFLPPDVDELPAGQEPWFLPMAVSSVTGPGATVLAPPDVEAFWIEPELAIVIGQQIHAPTAREAADAIFGYTCFNDITAPQFLFEDVAARTKAASLDILRAKCQDTFASIGPVITTDISEDEIVAGLQITGRVNGQLAGEGNTRRSKFTPREWVRFAATATTLRQGDVLALGTPCPCDAVTGDSFEIEVEGIGSLAGQIARTWER